MKVLYAEDEKQLSAAVSEILRMEGFDVTPVYDGKQALDELEKDYFDAVILDIMMPVMNGTEVLHHMRKKGDHTSVLMLTAKSTLNDRISGLTDGADDYLAKPFAMKELVVRLHSLIRRNHEYRHSMICFSNIKLNSNSGELTSDIGSLRLSNTESELLIFLIKNNGVFFTGEQINDNVWNGKESPEKAELYVYYLKNKLTQIRSSANIIIKDNKFTLGE